MTNRAVEAAVAEERRRAIEIVRCAYDREGGAELSCVRLALVLVQQGVDVATAKGIIDSSAAPAVAPNAIEEFTRQWTENPTPEASA